MGRAVIYAMSLGPEKCRCDHMRHMSNFSSLIIMGHGRDVKLTRNQSFGPEAADRLSLGVYTYRNHYHHHQASSSKNVPSRVDPCGDLPMPWGLLSLRCAVWRWEDKYADTPHCQPEPGRGDYRPGPGHRVVHRCSARSNGISAVKIGSSCVNVVDCHLCTLVHTYTPDYLYPFSLCVIRISILALPVGSRWSSFEY